MIKIKPYHQQILFGLLLTGLFIYIFINSQRPSSSLENKGVENVIEYEVLKQFKIRSSSEFDLTDLGNLCSQAVAEINGIYPEQYKYVTVTYHAKENVGDCHFTFADKSRSGYFFAKFQIPDVFQYEATN